MARKVAKLKIIAGCCTFFIFFLLIVALIWQTIVLSDTRDNYERSIDKIVKTIDARGEVEKKLIKWQGRLELLTFICINDDENHYKYAKRCTSAVEKVAMDLEKISVSESVKEFVSFFNGN